MSAPALDTPARRAGRSSRPVLPPAVSLLLLASIIVSFLASSSAPTPLYAYYQVEWHFSAITTTVVFGVYALAVLAALMTLGKISDHVGRKPVLFAALGVQAASMLVFATADGVTALLVARIVQGLATGAAAGTIGAGLLDISRSRGTFANAVAPGTGTATGALVSGLVVQFLPHPARLIYLILIAVFAVQAAGLLFAPETVTRQRGALRSMVPEISLPGTVRRPVLVSAPVLFAVWALAGFYGALGPAIVHALSGSGSVVLGGLSLCVLAGVAALSVVVFRNLGAVTVMVIGIAALILGVAVTLLAVSDASIAGFFAGTAIAGLGFGSGFQGGIRMVLPQARPHERSGVLSLVYLISYLGFGIPAVIAGMLVVDAGGLLTTIREYGAAVIVLAVLALAGLVLPRSAPDARPRGAPGAAAARQATETETLAAAGPAASDGCSG